MRGPQARVLTFVCSLIGLGTEGLVVLCLNMHGSHVIEAFVNGTVDVNKKKKLLKLLKGCFAKVRGKLIFLGGGLGVPADVAHHFAVIYGQERQPCVRRAVRPSRPQT